MNRKKDRVQLLIGIVAMIVMTVIMWDISRFLGVVLLVGLIAMVGMYVAVAIESTSDDSRDY
jgi:hypothetical protein